MRYLCIHGHFYQPPRENPWLEAIELEDSAAPYHDWNERITRECYGPNAVARILDSQGSIRKLVNNYARVSFNFGPTLLSWLEAKAPEVYAAILEADRQSREYFSGHGSAIAQVYNHVIMPLASRRDRITQVRWGLRDFERRFQRPAEGMWLPETAVDVESLDLLAEAGMRFVVLAPHQARRVRLRGDGAWQEAASAQFDTTMPYLHALPSGRSIAIFFYDGAISRAVAFEGLLSDGERWIGRLAGAFDAASADDPLVHIATDGESYGHHHRFGEMALAYALDQIEARQLARLTNYGAYLEEHPPTHEVEIVENSSWSCTHGVDRWWRDCGCHTGAPAGWNQQWRTPLREALDWLRDQVAPVWERKARELLRDPWAARDDYIQVIRDRSEASIQNFFARHALAPLSAAQTSTGLELLELQRHALLMYTSCGWFFNDLAGLETVQVLRYAGRAVQLAQHLLGDSLEASFARRLAAARSNVAEEGDGARVYHRRVVAARADGAKLAADYALQGLLDEFGERKSIYCYDAELGEHVLVHAGRATLGIGRLALRSRITLRPEKLTFAAIHLGDHNMSAGVAEEMNDQAYKKVVEAITEPFQRADLTAALREIERRLGAQYSLRSLFRDEQRAVLQKILGANLEEAESLYRQIYQPRVPLMRFLTDLGIPLPRGFAAAADFVVNHQMRALLEESPLDRKRMLELLQIARLEGIALESASLEFAARQTIDRLARGVLRNPSLLALQQFRDAAEALQQLPFSLDLWQPQNLFYRLLHSRYPEHETAAHKGDPAAQAWLAHAQAIASLLRVSMPEPRSSARG
jgi:hypothetical protein